MRRQHHFTRLGLTALGNSLSAASLCIRLGALAVGIAGAGAALAAGASSATTDAVKPAATQQQPRGKPTSGVVVRYVVPTKIAVGETVTLRLQFSGVTAADGAMVEVRDPSTHETLASMRLERGERRIVELPYTSVTYGMQFVDVITVQRGRSSVQSVPVRVGSGELRLKTQGTRQTTATGENVISLQAVDPGVRR